MSAAPALSLIIPTLNRLQSLRRLLPSLTSIATHKWELVIVDNGSTDGTLEWLREAETAGHVRVVLEPRRGKGWALNTGIQSARGDLLVFSDDDIDPDAAWLDELSAAANRHADVDVFGGKIRVDPTDVPDWILRSRNLQEILLTQHDLGDHEIPYPPNRFPQGPNMAVRRRALRDLPLPWSLDIGPGSALPVGDEKCFFYRIGQGGGKTRVYVATAVVRHRALGRELRLRSALRRCYWGGYSGGLLTSLYPTQLERTEGKMDLFHMLGKTKSWQELSCVMLRAAGYLAGRWHGNAKRAS